MIFIGLVVTGGLILLIPLLPWRIRRIQLTNHMGTLLGSGILKISGCPLTIRGRELLHRDRPAIYIGNHTSVYDAFSSIWLSPVGTVGVAKKQIIYYPFYGLAWLLSGHLTLDRGNTDKAKASMRAMGEFVRKNRLHVFMWPEGTRSKSGRLLPFKKGVVHLALQTGLPIVPMVTSGAHKAWGKKTLLLKRTPIHIQFLPAIDTSRWSEATLDTHVEELYQAFLGALPADQQPDVMAAAA